MAAAVLACEECDVARESPDWKRFDSLKCVYCAARLIKRVAQFATSRSEVTERRQKALAAAVERGLSETEIRGLVERGPLVQPRAPKDKKK